MRYHAFRKVAFFVSTAGLPSLLISQANKSMEGHMDGCTSWKERMDGQDGCNDSDLAYRESPGDRKYSKAWGQTDQELEQPNLAGFFGTEFSDEGLGPPTEIMKNNATYCFGPAQGLELAPFGADFLENKKQRNIPGQAKARRSSPASWVLWRQILLKNSSAMISASSAMLWPIAS